MLHLASAPTTFLNLKKIRNSILILKEYDLALGLLKKTLVETKWTKPITRVHGPAAANTLALIRSLKGKELYFPGMGTTESGNEGKQLIKKSLQPTALFSLQKSRQKIKSTSLHKAGGLLAWRTGECQKQNFDCAQVMLETQKVERIITSFRQIVCPTPSHWGPIRGSGKKLGWRYDASNSFFTVNITLLLGWQRWRHRGGLLP